MTRQTPIVRRATRADQADMMKLCRELHADNGIFKMDDGMVQAMLDRAFDERGGIIGVIDGDGEIAACIYLLFSTFWYSREDHLEELFSFVREPYRKSRYAAMLIEFAQRCADVIPLKLLIGVLTTHRMESKVRLYRRELGMPAGAFFLYDPSGASHDLKASDAMWKTLYVHERRNKANGMSNAAMTTSAMPMLPLATN